MRQLQELDLSHTEITDAGVVCLRDLERLRWLVLDGARITDTGAEYLKCCTNCGR